MLVLLKAEAYKLKRSFWTLTTRWSASLFDSSTGPTTSTEGGSCYVHPAILLGHPAKSEWTILSFREIISERSFFQKHSGKSFIRKIPEESPSRRRRCDSGRTLEYVPEERVPECFRKKTFFFWKKVLPEFVWFLKNAVFF